MQKPTQGIPKRPQVLTTSSTFWSESFLFMAFSTAGEPCSMAKFSCRQPESRMAPSSSSSRVSTRIPLWAAHVGLEQRTLGLGGWPALGPDPV